jgi:hypothetical protein
LRKWMIADGLWLDRKQRQRRIHQPRPRRDCVGELVQVDGSEHWWFEDRGPQCTLLVFVDDATSRLMHLQFVESESTFAYFHAARAYVEAWGKPVAFYSDKHGVFRVNHPGALGGDGMTQFGRALHALNIDIICANSSPAKGRVERAHKTLQACNALLPDTGRLLKRTRKNHPHDRQQRQHQQRRCISFPFGRSRSEVRRTASYGQHFSRRSKAKPAAGNSSKTGIKSQIEGDLVTVERQPSGSQARHIIRKISRQRRRKRP